jgi:kynurenine 3-monooxygenase
VYQFIENPVGYFGTLFTKPWHYSNKAVLLGDSAHTIVPFLWQAVNVGFNDCVTLDGIIEQHGFGKAFEIYSERQKPNGDAIATLSIQNFDKLANPKHILFKQLEIKISQLFPNNYCSKYRAVFYGEHSYS